MSNKIMNSGQLLGNLNRNIDKSHHKKVEELQTDKKIPEQTKKNDLTANFLKQDQNDRLLQKNQVKVKPRQKQKQKSQSEPTQKTQPHQKDQKPENLRRQDERPMSNISRASEMKKRKNTFKQNFQNSSHPIEEQELGESLHEILALQIGKLISEPLAEVIEATMKQKQKTVFIVFTRPDKEYLQNLIELQKRKENNCMTEIQTLLSRRQNSTLDMLDNGELYIDRQRGITTKKQLQQLGKLDVARLVKIKQGTIRSKLGLLQDKMFEFEALQNSSRTQSPSQSLRKYQQQKLQQICDPHNFSLNSQKTKIANDYVKHLHHQKLILLKNLRQRDQKRNQIEKERQLELKQAGEMRNAAKKQDIQQRIGHYQKKKQSQNRELLEKSKQVQQFLKEYKKSLPLYKKKEKQFTQKYQKGREKDIQQKLKDIKQNRRSLSLNEIKEHEDKYMQRKSLEQSKKEEQFKMLLKANQAAVSGKQYFKGFYHDKVKVLDKQEKLKFYSLREETKLKVQRMAQFDKQIRKLHKPKVDLKKKEELQRVIQFDELKKKKIKKVYRQVVDENGTSRLEAYYEEIPEVDPYKEGNKYMEISKSLAKKTKQENVSRYSEEPIIDLESLQQGKVQKKRQSYDWENPSAIISQQKDIWRLRSKQLHQMTDQISPNNFLQVKKNLELMDDKAKLKEELLRHKQSDAHEMMHQKSMLDQFYLQSIKNKIKLLNE